MNRRRFLQSALGGLSASVFAAAAPQAPARPNIVLFLTDDLGYADLGCYGATDIRTPNIDRLAREGVRFTQCYSNGPVCTPTRAALLTGRYQQRAGLEWAIPPAQRNIGLPADHPTIARYLKDAGYKTGIFGKWHLGYEPHFGPNRHGFEEFFGLLSGNVDFYSHQENTGEPDLYENLQPIKKEGYLTELIGGRAVDFVHRHAAHPFFLYVPFNAVHWPFQAPGRPQDVRTRATWFDGTRRDYALMVESVDQQVGRVLDALDTRHLAANTLVIFTNDNGGERLSDNLPFFHRKATLWEGGIRVPGIMRFPGRLPVNQISGQVAASMDLAPTILAAAGVPIPARPAMDGINLLPILHGDEHIVERTLCWRINRSYRQQQAVRQGNWKYLKDGEIEMIYNLQEDPAERQTLVYRHPEKLKELRDAYAAWENDLNRQPPLFIFR